MIIYIGYVMSDYAHALWMSKDKTTVAKAIEEYHKRGGRCSTWIKKYNVGKELIELNCD